MIPVTNCCINRIKIGAQQSYKNLTMFPLIITYSTPRNCLAWMAPLSGCITKRNQSTQNAIRNHSNGRKIASWDYIEQFARVDGQIGAIFLINGKLADIIRLHSTEAFKYSFIKIVEFYAKKADDDYDPKIDLTSSKLERTNFLKYPVDFGINIKSHPGSNQNLAYN